MIGYITLGSDDPYRTGRFLDPIFEGLGGSRAYELESMITWGFGEKRPMIMVTLSLIVFALTVERLGFVPASALLIVLSGLSESPPNWRALAILCVVLIPAAYFLFIVLLGIPAPAFDWNVR